MIVSNKFLAFLLISAMVISVVGTVLSLDMMRGIHVTGFSVEATGSVGLEVVTQLSITTEDGSSVNFGTCRLSNESDFIINSEGTEDSHRCTGVFPQPIFIRNDGTVHANVSMAPSIVGEAQGGTFLPSPDNSSSIFFKLLNEGFSPFTGGCQDNLNGSYTVFSNTSNVDACTNLNAHSTANSFSMHIQIFVPRTAVEGPDSITITFHASEAG